MWGGSYVPVGGLSVYPILFVDDDDAVVFAVLLLLLVLTGC